MVSPEKAVYTQKTVVVLSSATMSPIQFKLCNEEGTVRLATFPEPPAWRELAARVHHIYGIPPADIAISYTDR